MNISNIWSKLQRESASNEKPTLIHWQHDSGYSTLEPFKTSRQSCPGEKHFCNIKNKLCKQCCVVEFIIDTGSRGTIWQQNANANQGIYKQLFWQHRHYTQEPSKTSLISNSGPYGVFPMCHNLFLMVLESRLTKRNKFHASILTNCFLFS